MKPLEAHVMQMCNTCEQPVSLRQCRPAADEDGDTPLHNAARGNHVDIVTLLLSSGADPNMRNTSGNTPAQEAEDEDVIKVLSAAVDSEGAADA
eukprot:364630-Chlamydomonas_euryale.AAC.12